MTSVLTSANEGKVMDDRRQLRLDVFRALLEKSGHLVMTVTPQELQKDAVEVADALWVLPKPYMS